MSVDLQPVRDDVLRFAAFAGVKLYAWQVEALSAACERVDVGFRYRIAGVSTPRGDGKSFLGSVVGLWRLLTGPPGSHVLSVALDYSGAAVIVRHAKGILARCAALGAVVEEHAGGLVVPSTGSRWEIRSAEHTSSRGLHPDVVLYDETGWARDDELFSSLLASQASAVDPLMLVTSTVGRKQSGPLWRVKALAESGDPAVLWWYSERNRSPLVTRAFLDRQRRVLPAAAFAREHQNRWVDAADSFLSAEDVDAAMHHGWREQFAQHGGRDYHAFVDLGVTHDPSVICVGHVAEGTVYVDRLVTFQGTKRRPVSLDAVEAELLTLSRAFRLTRIRVESWQGLQLVERLQQTGLAVEVFNPTAQAHRDEWPVLAQCIGAGQLVCFPHARLREELCALVVEIGPQGAKVCDKGKVHQDHAVALRGVVASLRTGIDLSVAVTRGTRSIRDAMAREFGDERLGL